jgi:hypothetical protein
MGLIHSTESNNNKTQAFCVEGVLNSGARKWPSRYAEEGSF